MEEIALHVREVQKRGDVPLREDRMPPYDGPVTFS